MHIACEICGLGFQPGRRPEASILFTPSGTSEKIGSGRPARDHFPGGEQRLEPSLTTTVRNTRQYAATLRHCPSPLFFPILSIVALALDRLSQRFRHPAGVDFVGSSPLFLSL
jgi:hypothetical protein